MSKDKQNKKSNDDLQRIMRESLKKHMPDMSSVKPPTESAAIKMIANLRAQDPLYFDKKTISQQAQKSIPSLSRADWKKLEILYQRVVDHREPFYQLGGGERNSDGSIRIPYAKPAAIVLDIEHFFYDKNLVIDFDWAHWDEGRAIFARNGEDKFEDVSLEDTLKLFTAIMRNARFNEGAWGRLFESGDGIKLLKHLLTFNPHTNA